MAFLFPIISFECKRRKNLSSFELAHFLCWKQKWRSSIRDGMCFFYLVLIYSHMAGYLFLSYTNEYSFFSCPVEMNWRNFILSLFFVHFSLVSHVHQYETIWVIFILFFIFIFIFYFVEIWKQILKRERERETDPCFGCNRTSHVNILERNTRINRNNGWNVLFDHIKHTFADIFIFASNAQR